MVYYVSREMQKKKKNTRFRPQILLRDMEFSRDENIYIVYRNVTSDSCWLVACEPILQRTAVKLIYI